MPGYAAHPASPSDLVLALGTGLGPVSPAATTGANSLDALRTNTTAPVVRVAGRPALVSFAGLSPEFVGVNQLNLFIPQEVAGSNTAAIEIQSGGVVSAGDITMAVQIPSPQQVPAAYQDLYARLQSDLNAFHSGVDDQWSGTKSALRFSAELYSADNLQDVLTPGYYDRSITPYLNQLQSLGIKAVKVQMGFPILYQPFFTDYVHQPEMYGQFLAFYKKLVQDVHSHGMKFIAQCQEVQVGRSTALNVKPYYQSLSWDEYQSARSAFLVNVAQQLNPDYLLVQTEPDTEEANTGQTQILDVNSDLGMIARFLRDLKSAGAHTMVVGSGMGTWLTQYQELAQGLAQMPDLDLIDIHVYPINMLAGNNLWQKALQLADIATQAGKKVAVSEAWLYKVRDEELLSKSLSSDDVYARDVFSFWAPLDHQFLHAMVKFAHLKRLEYMNASLSRYFFAYVDYNQVVSACGDPCSLQQSLQLANGPLTTALQKGTFTDTGSYYGALIQ